jgi:hypothetical protein
MMVDNRRFAGLWQPAVVRFASTDKEAPMMTRERLETGWKTTEVDRQATAELASRIPPRIFDAHMHLYDVAHFPRLGPLLE